MKKITQIIVFLYTFPILTVGISKMVMNFNYTPYFVKVISSILGTMIFPIILLLWGVYCSINEKEFGFFKSNSKFILMFVVVPITVFLSMITSFFIFSDDDFKNYLINTITTDFEFVSILRFMSVSILIVVGYVLTNIFLDSKKLIKKN